MEDLTQRERYVANLLSRIEERDIELERVKGERDRASLQVIELIGERDDLKLVANAQHDTITLVGEEDATIKERVRGEIRGMKDQATALKKMGRALLPQAVEIELTSHASELYCRATRLEDAIKD